MEDRFECLMDPCGRYLIWDNEGDAPVMCGRELLAYTSVEEAARLARILNGPPERTRRNSKPYRNVALHISGIRL